MTAEQEIDFIRGSLDHCVKCTICETACPVADEVDFLLRRHLASFKIASAAR